MKATIKNTPFKVEVEPFFVNGWFAGFKESNDRLYKPYDLDFSDSIPVIESQPDVLLRECKTSTHLRHCLIGAGYDPLNITLGELAAISRREYSKMRGFGKKSYMEMQELLQSHGLKLED